MVACCASDAALGGPFLAKTRYHIACGRRKTASSPVWDLFVRLQKRLLNDGYAARRSICAFSAVEGMWAVRAYRVVLRRFDECDSQRRLFDPTEPLLLRGGVCRPPGRTSESRCSSNTAQTPTMLWRGHMLMILARLVRSESFWAIVKVRSPHTGPEFGYPRQTTGSARWPRSQLRLPRPNPARATLLVPAAAVGRPAAFRARNDWQNIFLGGGLSIVP